MNHAPQVEIRWTEPEAFALVVEQTTDGDRLARQREQLEADRAESDRLQSDLTDLIDATEYRFQNR